jgi:deoxyribonuclease V
MLAAIDVAYTHNVGIGSVMTFTTWTDAEPVEEKIVRVPRLPKYVPGQFFKRELPVLLAAMKAIGPVEMIVLDGFVRLDDKGTKGLGTYLFDELMGQVPVVGVSKAIFTGSPGVAVLRGASLRPLFVTAAGLPDEMAAKLVKVMHGTNRIPTLLKRGDTLCRKAAGLKAT